MHKKRLSILAIGPQDVFPTTDGGKEGIFGGLQALAKHCDVTYAFPSRNQICLHHGYKHGGIESVAVEWNPPESLVSIVFAIFRMKPYKFDKYSCKAAIKAFSSELCGLKFDAILCFHAHTARLGQGIATTLNLQIPIVVREHNIEYELVSDYRRSLSLFNRIVGYPIEWLTLLEERRIWSQLDSIAFLSDRDIKVAFKSGCAGNFFLAREGVPIPPKRLAKYPDESLYLLILFNPKSIQSVFNLRKFLNDYWMLASSDPNIVRTNLKITGATTEQLATMTKLDVNCLSDHRIQGLGFVDDLSPIFKDALALISPTFIGGGIRKKILESMANQVPVISTPNDIEACSYFSKGKNILEMRDLNSFCEAVSKLNLNQAYWSELSQSGRTTIEKYANWNQFAEAIIIKIEQLIRSRNAAVLSD